MSTFSEPFLQLEPVYQPRVWGGRMLAEKLDRSLPDEETPFGESWEVSAREEADSIVRSGSLAGRTLSQLWRDSELKSAIFGDSAPSGDRFPLLCKILDAKEKLSIQVHPPADLAESLGGESKTEVWYIAHADPGARIYVGVKSGVTRESFREALENGSAEQCVHAVPVTAGQHIFIPSGRLHAIGEGLLIYEMQENSDTTFRVFDWNRIGLNGQPRDLHIEASLRCIDFSDVEPEMDRSDGCLLVDCDRFRLEKHPIRPEESIGTAIGGRFAVVTVTKGELSSGDERWKEGDFFLVPANVETDLPVAKEPGAEILVTTW